MLEEFEKLLEQVKKANKQVTNETGIEVGRLDAFEERVGQIHINDTD